MERTYIKMPILENNPIYSFADFRARFFELTGMHIPETCGGDDVFYLSGELKSHLTSEIQSTLESEYPMCQFSDGWPVGFELTVDEE